MRARRIKGLEADKRKQEKNKAQSEKLLRVWTSGLTLEQARLITGRTEAGYLPVIQRAENDLTWSAYDVLQSDEERYSACPAVSLEEVIEVAKKHYPRVIVRAERWISHYENRLAYERAMLAESGGIITDRKGPEKGGGVSCWCSPGYGRGWSYIQKVNKVSVSVLDTWGNDGDRPFSRTIPFDKLKAVMTAAEVQSARAAGELNELPSKIGFYLSQPVETRDEASVRVHFEAVAAAGGSCGCKEHAAAKSPEPDKPTAKDFDAMRDTLKAGVQVVSAPQLFPTPRELAERMAEEADIQPGHAVLEPSAGTGNLITAILELGFNGNIHLDAIEINYDLCKKLRSYGMEVEQHDFLEVEKPYCPDAPDGWDRIVMNPPFINGADIKHIQHAIKLLKPGGRIVALCADGPRQRHVFNHSPSVATYEELPPGSFSAQGTNVSVALVIINKPPAPQDGCLF